MERTTEIVIFTPVPFNATVRGDPVALSAKLRVVFLAPVVVGLNVTLAVQVVPVATVPQLCVIV